MLPNPLSRLFPGESIKPPTDTAEWVPPSQHLLSQRCDWKVVPNDRIDRQSPMWLKEPDADPRRDRRAPPTANQAVNFSHFNISTPHQCAPIPTEENKTKLHESQPG